MRNVAVSISVLSCLMFGGLSRGRMSEAAEEAKQTPIRVVVDPRVELMSVIFRLAGNHEYNQGRVKWYTNPVIDRHESELKAAGEKLFARVESAMQRQAYGNWKTMLYESLVRASTLRYVRQYDGTAAASAAARQERMRGFPWVGDLSALLGEYEAQRDRYQAFQSEDGTPMEPVEVTFTTGK